ncbi:LysM peptidoglycan-binding domain-containing protein [Bacillus sp. DJP31]|uniref:LysM peptidoglycan-binding domain-containing protein n=1 Tax=Bacillus sp. DJP31 TaxID=3409789 RepID=UPI003BB7D7D9
MKKLSILLVVLLVVFSIFYDLKTGTLPLTKAVAATDEKNNAEKEGKKQHQNNDQSIVEVIVKPGDTVLSLIERHQQGSLPISISTVIKDFQKLNNGTLPEKIQIGKTYKLPVYK